MNIGIDLDNTIVCYDQVFLQLATEVGLPSSIAARGKQAIRDLLRKSKREGEWTVMQGKAYGSRMQDAVPFPGVLEFIQRAMSGGNEVNVVSHRSRQPYLGENYDLHAAARKWLDNHGLGGVSGVFLEDELAAKARRIRVLGCEVFIDDLPEFLAHPEIPSRTRKIHFDPSSQLNPAGFERATTWDTIEKMLL